MSRAWTEANLELDVTQCRLRQQRVREMMAERGIGRCVFAQREHVQYLTAFRSHRLLQAAVSLDEQGTCVLAAPGSIPDYHAADHVVTFEAQYRATIRQEQLAAAASALASAVGPPREGYFGVEFSSAGPALFKAFGIATGMAADIEPAMWQLRRCKDPDELKLIRRAIECTTAMYRRAREIIRPGITELDVYNALHAVAVEVAGEPLTALGNDFQCGTPGGAPRPRPACAGELYILDLGPAYRGYYADNCRTFAVSGEPTPEQQRAWNRVMEVFDMVEAEVRPGVSCAAIFHKAQSLLDTDHPGGFFHHLGHGFGLTPHEGPHLNPHWDDVFELGDVFTVEPGLYGEALAGGLRIEENYRVTETGLEKLTHIPRHL